MFVRPAIIPEGMEGAGTRFRVRDPLTHQFLVDEGEHKPASDYWLRRLLDGGVEEASEPEVHPDDADPGAQIASSNAGSPILPGAVEVPIPEGDAP